MPELTDRERVTRISKAIKANAATWSAIRSTKGAADLAGDLQALVREIETSRNRIAELESRLKQAYVIPPLVWVENVISFSGVHSEGAVTSRCVLTVNTTGDRSFWVFFDGYKTVAYGNAESPDLAKAAAETAYRKHITAGLIPAWGG